MITAARCRSVVTSQAELSKANNRARSQILLKALRRLRVHQCWIVKILLELIDCHICSLLLLRCHLFVHAVKHGDGFFETFLKYRFERAQDVNSAADSLGLLHVFGGRNVLTWLRCRILFVFAVRCEHLRSVLMLIVAPLVDHVHDLGCLRC